eukprot:PITA_30293
MDVKIAFLNGVIEEEVYIEQPEGFEVFSSESHVCRLKRALYGLKQAPRAWYLRIDNYFTGLGFSKSEADPNLYQIVVEDRKSTSGGVFSIGSTTISWYSREQRSVALSSAEVEYMASILAACEAIWMRNILFGLFISHLDPTVIYCDNQSCIKLSANPVFHDRSKHIDIRYHHIRDCVQRRIMLLSYIPTEDRDADILTKALTRGKFEYHRGMIGVADNPYLVEREC